MRPRHQGDACNWGRTHKHRTQAASPVRGVGPQPWPQDAASSDGQPRQGRALLCAEPIRHQNCIIHFINSRLTYGPGLENITPWSWGLTRASTRTVPHGHGSAPCSAQQPYMAAMVGPGCQRKINTDATASSPVSRLQPAPRQNYAIQSNLTPTYGPLLAGIHHGQSCSRHTGHHCQTGTARY